MNTVKHVPTLLWKRIPWIVAYALALTGVLFLIEFASYRYSEGEKFLRYNRFHINTVEEGQDVPFEACKETDTAYRVVGARKIYRIPEGKGEIDKVLVKTYPLDSIITTTPCVSAFISQEQYAFKAGTYQVYTDFNFTVKYGNQKSVTFKSNIFTVLPNRPATVEQIEAKIRELEKQIKLLRIELQKAREGASVTTGGRVAQSQPSSSEQRSTPKSEPKTKTPPKENPEEPEPPADDGVLPDWIPLLGGL